MCAGGREGRGVRDSERLSGVAGVLGTHSYPNKDP